jgi:hypothetical protein
MGNDGGKARWPQGIWAAVPTPFLPDQSLDLSGIAQNGLVDDRDVRRDPLLVDDPVERRCRSDE